MRAVIFDLDGTLLDTLQDLHSSANFALERYGYPRRTLDEVRRFVGNGVKKLMLRSLDVRSPEECPDFDGIMDAFRAHYGEHGNDATRPYPGVMELLGRLRGDGMSMAIVSNKPDAAVKRLNDIYFKEYISVAIGEDEAAGVRKKPAPDTVYAALRALGGCPVGNAVYVGDSEVDVETAQNAGLPCISATWGFRGRDWLVSHGAGILCGSPEEVRAALENWSDIL